jgi:integrase
LTAPSDAHKKLYMKKQSAKNSPPNGGIKEALTPDDVNLIGRQLASKGLWREYTLFRTGIDSMLRACDLVRLKIDDVVDWRGHVLEEIEIEQKKTSEQVAALLTQRTREAIKRWIAEGDLLSGVWLFPGGRAGEHLSESQYRRIAKGWFEMAGLDVRKFSTHSIRRTKASQIYEQTGNLEVIRQLLGHTSLKHTQKYLGVDRRKAMKIAKEVKI